MFRAVAFAAPHVALAVSCLIRVMPNDVLVLSFRFQTLMMKWIAGAPNFALSICLKVDKFTQISAIACNILLLLCVNLYVWTIAFTQGS